MINTFKKILIIFFLGCSGSILGQESSPSISETINWLKGYLSFHDEDSPTSHSFEYDSIQKLIIFSEINNTKNSNEVYKKNDYVPINKINPDNIEIESYSSCPDCIWITFHTINNESVILSKSWTEGDSYRQYNRDQPMETYESWTFVRLPPNLLKPNLNLDLRIKKAIIHLVEICGGSHEKF